MKEYIKRLKSSDNFCLPLNCECGIVYIHIRPTATEPIRTTETAPGTNLIVASISKIKNLGDIDKDCRVEWNYTFSYDETQLVGDDPTLRDCDIENICCEDCKLKAAIKIIDKKIADLQPQ